jgi:hypothetical protein
MHSALELKLLTPWLVFCLYLSPMKKILLLLLFAPAFSQAQTLFAFTDFNNFFKVFRDGYFMQIEHNAVSDVTIGDEMVAYMNSAKDFKVYEKDRSTLITNQMVQYKMSDHILAWNINTILNYRTNGRSHAITNFAGQYEVTDSLLVYQDTRYNTVNVIWNEQTFTLYTTPNELYMPEAIGDNVVVFRDLGEVYKVFWRGKIYELGVWTSTPSYHFEVGVDIVAFNDPATRTFAIFEDGQFMDVEQVFVNKYKVGRGYLIYEDIQGNLKYYAKGDRFELSAFPQFWDVKDDAVIWGEANLTQSYIFGKKAQVCNYIPKEYVMKNDVIAFKNNLGGVSAFINGSQQEISTLPDLEITINRHSVMTTQKNRSVMVLFNKEIYRN